jgi:hypothetical protein
MLLNILNFIHRKWLIGIVLLVLVGLLVPVGIAQSQTVSNPQQQSTGVLFEDVQIFNGTSAQLSAPSNVLVVGNKIQDISTTSISAPSDVTRINGNGKVLMPGLIDAHTHLFWENTPIVPALSQYFC